LDAFAPLRKGPARSLRAAYLLDSRKVNRAMLQPAKTEVARALGSYRSWERAMLARPGDHAVRAAFEDCGYTLCVLMAKRCAREAADAAEQYLRAATDVYHRERRGPSRRNGVARLSATRSLPCLPAET
jgi:hypothetical protein